MLDAKIETFIKVVELKSYTAAANALSMTQPGVTQHIKKLEDYYDCQLIDSSRRSVRLTDAGQLLYQQMCAQKANQQQFMESIHAIAKPLNIGATLSIADYYLPELLSPEILLGDSRFRIIVENSTQILRQLQQGELDCAFIEGLFDNKLFESHVFHHAAFIPVASVRHPLVSGENSWHSLYTYPLVLREAGSGTRELLESYLYQQNDTVHSFSRIIELGNFAIIKHLIKHSDAITFAYEGVVKKELAEGSLCRLAIEGFDFSHPLHFIYRKGSVLKKQYEAFYKLICPSVESF